MDLQHQIISILANFAAACQGTGSASDAPAAPASDPAEAMEVDGKSNDELMTALRASKDHVPPLNVDGVYLFLGLVKTGDRLEGSFIFPARMTPNDSYNDLFFLLGIVYQVTDGTSFLARGCMVAG